MPTRRSSFKKDPSVGEVRTDHQILIYKCETEIRTALPDVYTFKRWAGIIDHVWEKVRHRAEDGPPSSRGRVKYLPFDRERESPYGYPYRPYQRLAVSMYEIPVWIERARRTWTPTWSALWSEPNIIVAGHHPLHAIWAVHEVAHMLVYYQHGWFAADQDNGHGPIWKQTYLDLLYEFYPKHGKLLERTFVQNGVDI